MKSKVFDFDKMAFGEISVGSSWEGAEETGILINQRLDEGYSINVVNGVVDNFEFIMSITPINSNYRKPFSGSFAMSKTSLLINVATSPQQVRSVFGSEASYWNDGVEENLQFLLGKYCVEFSWHVDGSAPCLTYISVGLNN